MFPSNSPLISSSDQTFQYSIDYFESNKVEGSNGSTELPFSFLDFPFPFEDTIENFLLQFQHQQPLAEPAEPHQLPEVSTMKKLPYSKGRKHIMGSSTEQIQKNKATCILPRRRKDRHSKIHTARGLRDRRMRLSLQVSKRFFGLQDMLGFDKPSETVEWLLNQAKSEINQLAGKGSSLTNSECEGAVSSLEEVVAVNGIQEQGKEPRPAVKSGRTIKRSRNSALHHPLAKECRERARERARERTKEKMRLKQMGCWNPFGTGELGSGSFQIPGVDTSFDLQLAEVKEHSSLSKENWRTVEAICYEQRVSIEDFQFSE